MDGPTNFAINPEGDLLYVNSSNANAIVPFRIDRQTGRLSGATQPIVLQAPNVMLFAAKVSGSA